MNYPIWDLPAPGLLIAFVAIVHVFVSHFAVGGGLFLVLAERKARRANDEALLDYVRYHSRFFILLTLVFGAITGVGIWFTIGLVHPAATASLINAFVWGWAIEWVFFFTEIAAAIVYYYGWDRLTPKQHMTVGWIYFASAWASLAIINGILSFMMTPGSWISDHGFWSGFLNPTYFPTLAVRTLGAIGLAGVYAIFTASWKRWAPDTESARGSLLRWASYRWIVPVAVAMPFAILWQFSAAGTSGIPVHEIFGSASARLNDLAAVIFSTAKVTSGQFVAVNALRVAVFALLALFVLGLVASFLRGPMLRIAGVALMVAAFAAVGGTEWAREAVRKPYVIGNYMFVNGLRLAPPAAATASLTLEDPLRLDHVTKSGVLATSQWTRAQLGSNPTIAQEAEAGREMFRLLCSQCHTVDGYLAIRPLVKGQSSATLEALIARLATARHADGKAATWERGVQLTTWRNRRMPPFAGTDDERRALAIYLAQLGGGAVTPRKSAVSGAAIYEEGCAMCHGDGGEWPMSSRIRGRSADQIYEVLGSLPAINEMMPPFEGTDEERRALAQHLASMGGAK